ncbi:MAG: phosphodiester glycosidase family protein [Parachlamydiaceae bacterium]|nr:phosphodiester glycosidase family protein [Parachlamydiaceae bacterium]
MTKYKFPFKTTHLSLILALFICCSFQSNGYSYKHIKTDEPQSIHILEVDPNHFNIKPVHAFNMSLGRETVETLSKKNNAIAAVNGGFFKVDRWEGRPSGILKINNFWYGLPLQPRGAIAWDHNAKTVLMDRVTASVKISFSGKTYLIDGLNRPRKLDEIILYSSQFNSTTLTSPEGKEFIIINDKVVAIRNEGNSAIPPNGFVLSVGKCESSDFCNHILVGMPMYINIEITPQSNESTLKLWNSVPNIVGGTPLLIKNGHIIRDFSPEKTISSFLTARHARTAVGILPNGHWIFVVVDGNQEHLSKGMTMAELADYMFNLGSIGALNLDGGGSSTMVIANKVVNDPQGDIDEDQSLKKVRKVSDAILILEKNEY